MNKFNTHLKKGGGFGEYVNKTKIGSGYNYTVKYTIIATSGAGKTTLAVDLAIFDIKNYCAVVYVNDHFDDNTMARFQDCCEKAGIKYYQCMIEEDGALNVPKVQNALFIIDDTYKARKRNMNVERLVSELIIKGRHPKWSAHVIYIAHLNKYSHMEAINLSTAIFVEAPDSHFPITADIKPPYDTWYKLTNYLDPEETVMQALSFPSIRQKSDIVQRLKVKPSKCPKTKQASKREYEGDAEAGNSSAEEALESDSKKLVDGPTDIIDEPEDNSKGDGYLVKGRDF